MSDPDGLTKAEVRAAAMAQFKWQRGVRYSIADGRELGPLEKEEEYAFGVALLDAGLLARPGALLSANEWLDAAGVPQSRVSVAFRLIPYLCSGNLNLLKMEFRHKSLGEVPAEKVSAVIESRQPVCYQGVTLTEDTITICYRRLRLRGE